MMEEIKGRNYRITKGNVGIFLLSTIISPAARESLSNRPESVVEKNREMPFEEEENDMAEAIAEISHRNE